MAARGGVGPGRSWRAGCGAPCWPSTRKTRSAAGAGKAERRGGVLPALRRDGRADLGSTPRSGCEALDLWLTGGRRRPRARPAPMTGRWTRCGPTCSVTWACTGWPVEDLPVRHGRRPQVQVTVGLRTLLGLDDLPGDLAGYGPVTAETARRIAADATWRRLLTDPRTGRFDELSVASYEAPQDLADHVVARDRTCRWPGCRAPAARCDLDHRVPHPRGPTSAGEPEALCRSTTWSRPTPPPSRIDTDDDTDPEAACASPCPPGAATTAPPNPSSTVRAWTGSTSRRTECVWSCPARERPGRWRRSRLCAPCRQACSGSAGVRCASGVTRQNGCPTGSA